MMNIELKILIRKSIFILLLFIGFRANSQTNFKTIYDSTFAVGDLIKAPISSDLSCCKIPDGICPQTRDSIQKIALFLKNHPSFKIEIQSHTDTRGSLTANNILSQKRAESIKAYLVEACGVDSTQVTAKGYGETKLLIKDTEIQKVKTKEGKEELHAKNRRTLILIKEI